MANRESGGKDHECDACRVASTKVVNTWEQELGGAGKRVGEPVAPSR